MKTLILLAALLTMALVTMALVFTVFLPAYIARCVYLELFKAD